RELMGLQCRRAVARSLRDEGAVRARTIGCGHLTLRQEVALGRPFSRRRIVMRPIARPFKLLTAASLTTALFAQGCGEVDPQQSDDFAAAGTVEARQSALTVNSWTFKGPTGFKLDADTTGSAFYSATVTDVQFHPATFSYRFGTDAGGVFQWGGTQ